MTSSRLVQDISYGKVKEPVKRTHYQIIRNFENIDEVEEVLIKGCRQIIDQPNFVNG